MGHEAMSAQVVLYNEDGQNETLAEKVDMLVQANMACVRVVFLNWFLSSFLVSNVLIVQVVEEIPYILESNPHLVFATLYCSYSTYTGSIILPNSSSRLRI
jgi:hypothetical protein